MTTGSRTCSALRIVMLAAALAAGCPPALAQRGSTINSLSQQITADVEAGRMPRGSPRQFSSRVWYGVSKAPRP